MYMTIMQRDNFFEIVLEEKDFKKAWVAKISGLDDKYGFARDFLRKTNNIVTVTDDGYYEVADGDKRVFLLKEEDSIKEVTREEVQGAFQELF